MPSQITVLMAFDDGNAKSSSAETFTDAVKIARAWLTEWVDAPSSEPIPAINEISIRRVEMALAG